MSTQVRVLHHQCGVNERTSAAKDERDCFRPRFAPRQAHLMPHQGIRIRVGEKCTHPFLILWPPLPRFVCKHAVRARPMLPRVSRSTGTKHLTKLLCLEPGIRRRSISCPTREGCAGQRGRSLTLIQISFSPKVQLHVLGCRYPPDGGSTLSPLAIAEQGRLRAGKPLQYPKRPQREKTSLQTHTPRRRDFHQLH